MAAGEHDVMSWTKVIRVDRSEQRQAEESVAQPSMVLQLQFQKNSAK